MPIVYTNVYIPATKSCLFTPHPIGVLRPTCTGRILIPPTGSGSRAYWTVPPAASRLNPKSEGRNPKEGRIPKAEATLGHFGFGASGLDLCDHGLVVLSRYARGSLEAWFAIEL